ncbi:MAG: COQ9 family protein [Sphingomonas sp.]|jgi:ubiquinone biosynthesis protein COQ9|uniref:COQ9 family protein n=1 Tax=Sphingomonas sp. TaxID=28214 RepID=UPI0025EB3D32|nr:COQ9 family protein [Sphingomonas sp.]MBX9881205.1 COQ9 family protein [Sphingomonas sp.]
MTIAADATLDEIRLALAPLIAANAAFDGWTAEARDFAADQAGLDRDIARLAYDGGAVPMIDAWFASIDAAMMEGFTREALAAMKVRERIQALVEARLALLHPNRDALRRALAILALPQNAPRGLGMGWRSADAVWRGAGDTATDYNHYTKRAILGTVYAATITVFLDDESEDYAETRGFLARRIAGIMRFEKAKSAFLERTQNLPSLSRFVGRLRYPVA